MMTGYPSIDRPWLKQYPIEALNISIPDISMYQFIKESNEKRMSSDAMVYYGNRISYKEFFNNVKKVAGSLANRGVGKGDVVSIISLNTPETAYLIYALNSLGAIANLIVVTSSINEIKEIIENTKTKLVFILDKILEKYNDFNVCVPIIVLSMAESAKGVERIILKSITRVSTKFINYRDFISESKQYIEQCNNSDTPAVIIYTSGSTGSPKGVVLSSKNLNAIALMCFVSGKNYKAGEKFLNILPPFFSFGIGMMHLALYAGLVEIIQLVPQVKPIIKMLKKYKPDRFVIGPAFTDVIEKNTLKDMSFVKDLTGGGGSITQEKEELLNSILKSKRSGSLYLSGYGMTELASAVSMNFNDRHRNQSIGLPLTLINIKVIDLEDGHELTYNEEGELLVNSPGMMLEYYNDEEATKQAIEIIDDERWLHTGDIGKIDEDGFAYITGRLKRIYITSTSNGIAYKIFPQRMEEVVEKISFVERCAVVVVPDEVRKNVPIVYLVAKKTEDNISDSVREKIREELPGYYKPAKIIELEQLPMNQNQKIDYVKLEEYALDDAQH